MKYCPQNTAIMSHTMQLPLTFTINQEKVKIFLMPALNISILLIILFCVMRLFRARGSQLIISPLDPICA